MFQPLLEKIIDGCDGAVAGCVMGFDGIAVETVSRDQDVDAQTLNAEFSFVLKQVHKAAEVLEIGRVEEVVIRSEKLTYIVRTLTAEYFIGLVVLPHGNLGKGRFLIRKSLPDLQGQL